MDIPFTRFAKPGFALSHIDGPGSSFQFLPFLNGVFSSFMQPSKRHDADLFSPSLLLPTTIRITHNPFISQFCFLYNGAPFFSQIHHSLSIELPLSLVPHPSESPHTAPSRPGSQHRRHGGDWPRGLGRPCVPFQPAAK